MSDLSEVMPELIDNEWDFWDVAGLRCGGYSSKTDRALIAVFIETGSGREHWFEAIAQRLGLPACYVELLLEILCGADFCEYGTSPRGAWAIGSKFQANIDLLLAWYRAKWGEAWGPLPQAQAQETS